MVNFLPYAKIKLEYDEFYTSLLKNGRLPMHATEKGFWGCSIGDEVFELFKKINLQNYRSFIDLGSGDGKVVLIASLFVKKAYGIEFDKGLFEKSLEIKEKIGIQNADFFLADYFDFDLSKFDAVYCYPDNKMKRIENKLVREMKGILIHYGNNFFPPCLKKLQQFEINGTSITIYRGL